jgi:serine/threonine protein kinase/Tfp pilus assembly protein PilF
LRCLLQLGLSDFPTEDTPEAAASPETPHSVPTSTAEKPGDRIGRFRLVRATGEGGFGVVFEAEQEEPVRRRVALKVIKLGMDTKQVVARFEAERQALALMDHPNIAKVLDGGTTPAGRPYFVMELVAGRPITEYCDAERLSLDARLGLFAQVCAAVQHAHQKGIIHRDIKPSNILVQAGDPGRPGVPKVIDFGIAKATLGHRLTAATLHTALQQFIGTPAYMSPEQAEMSRLDVDTRSDIYGLGVLLYELLTGTTPFSDEDLRRAGYKEMQRIIVEQEPERPSTRLSTLQGQQRSMVARNRGTSELALAKGFPTDLDWIIMKCLEKDRARRYATPNDLAADIQRHLQNEPVLARPPTWRYRSQKLVRRHKTVFASAAVIAAGLCIGLGLATWQYIEKSKAYRRAALAEAEQSRLRTKAQTEAATTRQVAQFLRDMLTGVGPSVAQGRDTKLLREILDRAAERIGNELKGQPVAEAELRSTLGLVYLELGEYGQAEAMHRQVLNLATTVYGQDDPELASALDNMGAAFYRQGKPVEAEAMERQVLAMRVKALGTNNPEVAKSLVNLAVFLQGAGKLPEAETVSRQALTASQRLYGNENQLTFAALNSLACALWLEGKSTEAEGIAREVVAAVGKVLGDSHPYFPASLNNLARVLADEGKIPEAETAFRQALALRRKLLGDQHPDVAQTIDNLGRLLEKRGDLVEAETLLRQALAIRRRSLGNAHPAVALSLDNLAEQLADEQRLDEAEELLRECLRISEKALPDDWRTFSARSLLGGVFLSRKLYTEAEPLLISGYNGLHDRQDKIPASNKPSLRKAIERLIRLYEETGKSDKAAEWKQRLPELDRPAASPPSGPEPKRK